MEIMSEHSPTSLVYLDDPNQLELEAVVVAIFENDFGSTTIHLDQTVFYPQGGGQPYDQGTLTADSGSFDVQQVRFTPDGLVHHIGEFSTGSLSVGNTVKLNVNGERRALHNRLHTAGHLVDVAMIEAGYDFEPSKGYHFPDSPYVEYKGVIPAEEREQAKANLDAALQRMIYEDTKVAWRTVNDKEDLKEDCKFIPDYLP